MESETEAVAFATAGSVYTSNNTLHELQHRLLWTLRRDASCICNGQTSGALHVEQMAIDECKRLGDGKLCNAMHCKSISCNPILADNRDVLEHHYAAKQLLPQSI